MEIEINTSNDDGFYFSDGRLEASVYDQENGYDYSTSLTHKQTKELYEAMKKHFEK